MRGALGHNFFLPTMAEKRVGEGFSTGGGSLDSEDAARQRGQTKGNCETAGWMVLSAEERESLEELKRKKKNARKSPAAKKGKPTPGSHHDADRRKRYLAQLSRL